MKNIILIMCLVWFLNCQKQKSVSHKWIYKYDKSQLSNDMIKMLTKCENDSFIIANSNEKYNSTDILNETLPSKKIVFIAKKDSLFRLKYTQGGFAKHDVVYEFVTSKNKISEIKKFDNLTGISDFNTLDSLLSINKVNYRKYPDFQILK